MKGWERLFQEPTLQWNLEVGAEFPGSLGKKGNMVSSDLLIKQRVMVQHRFLQQPQAWEIASHGFLDKTGPLSEVKAQIVNVLGPVS